MIRFFRRAFDPFVQFSQTSGLTYIADQIFRRCSRNWRVFDYELMVQPIPDGDIAPASLTRDIEIRQIFDGDPLLSSTPRSKTVNADRFAQSAVCLGVFCKDVFAGYQWFCFGPYNEDEVRCRFVPAPRESVVFDFDLFILEEHRFGLAFLALWDGANSYLRERGIRFTTSSVSRFNTASRAAHMHLKWQRIGRAVFITGKRFQLMLSSLAPYVHLSVSSGCRPEVILDAKRYEESGCL